MIKTFENNIQGNDYVVGDIHGCYSKLREALHHLKFDRKYDRLFSVGDLVDRGTESEQCLQFLEKPWFHSVRGNHEQIAIDCFNGTWPADNYLINGGKWFLKLNADLQLIYVNAFLKLPIVIEIKTYSGLVGIVHAECPTNNWEYLKAALCDEHYESFVSSCMWGRKRITAGDVNEVTGVESIFVGHTPVTKKMSLGNHIYIDTGAVFGRELTIVKL